MGELRFGYHGGERERTFRSTNFDCFDAERAAGFYGMPELQPCDFVPEELIGFNYVRTTVPRRGLGVHFFIDDYQFERLWNHPRETIARMRRFDCVLTPDFSLYTDMPFALQVWNTYRSRMLGQMMQDAGIRVIPTLGWSTAASFDFCFDGLPEDGVVAVSTVGVARDKEAQQLWADGMNEALVRLHPRVVLCYGKDIGFDFGAVEVKRFDRRKIPHKKS